MSGLLLQEFDRLAQAQGGVARLRELILSLAVRGKLVPQDPADEPAESLLARSFDARRALALSGRIGREKPAVAVDDQEADFELPTGWVWCRLSQIAWPQAGFAFKSTQFNETGVGLPLIRIRDVGSDGEPTTFYSGEYRAEFVVEPGEWLVSMDGEFRVRRWHGATALLNQRVTRLVFFSDGASAEFVAAALQQRLHALQGVKAYTTVDHLSGKQISDAVIALPPTAEQVRIVARVDELMRLCDALEAKGRLEAEQHTRLLDTLLGTLTDSATPDELAANWQRVAEHFDLLLDRPEAVDALEQTILLLAVRGLLVLHAATEEPAIETLSRLLAKRTNEERDSTKTRADRGEAASEEERPFVLPPGWVWAKAQDLTAPSTIITYGVLKPEWVDVGVPTVRVQDIQAGSILVDQVGRCSTARAAKFVRTKLSEGDLLIAKDGATLGKTAFVPKSLEGGNITQHVLRFSIASIFDHDYVRLVIDSPHGQAWMRGETQGVALPGVNVGDFRRMPIPLPPVAEQTRIVARVTELRRLCADLRQRLAASQSTQSRLAEALVESVASA